MKIKAIIHQAEEGGYWAEVPALPEGDQIQLASISLNLSIEVFYEGITLALQSY